MKSLFTILILLTGILTTNLLAQPWVYDFGTATGSFSTEGTSDFLPDPPTNGGSDQVRVGNTGGGYALVNPGSDSELQITAASGMGDWTGTGVINKFSVYDYTPGTSFSIGFNIRFECDVSDNGTAYFFIGDGDYFINDTRYIGADLYTGIRWLKGAGDAFLVMAILNSAGTDYSPTIQNFNLNQEYYVEMFGNNTASSIDYYYNGTQTLSAYSYDIWIDGSITSVDNRLRSSNTMDNGDPIDSYMILAEGSTDNNLVVIVDDFNYSNLAAGILANIKVFLEGPYSGSGAMTTTLNTNSYIPLSSNDAYSTAVYGYTASTVASIPNADIVDWVLVELRTGTASGTKVGTRAAFLKSDGTIVGTDGSSPVTFTGLSDGNYYVVVRHRNHLAIMSASAIPLSGSSALYNFTTSQSKAYTTGTDPMVALTGSVYGMIAGDANADGFITSTDFNVFNPKFTSAASGYESSDWNLDRFVTSTDFNYFNPNFTTAKQSFVP